ncbi:hypothetical protein, partial [Actinotignum sp. GS-2025b]|uniref:hypothetical protein n=1 Tax=Actinotignum sp. GS-2025b TaxID=3427275 RepID=UPI003F45D865
MFTRAGIFTRASIGTVALPCGILAANRVIFRFSFTARAGVFRARIAVFFEQKAALIIIKRERLH